MAKIYCLYDDYYGDNDARELAHRMKDNDINAIYTMAKDLSKLIHGDCVLIPVPNRIGKAIATLLLAQWIIEFARDIRKLQLKLESILIGRERPSLYYSKKEGKRMAELHFGFRLSSSAPEGKKIYLVDSVLASGLTASAALRLVPSADVLVHSIDKKALSESVHRNTFSEVICGIHKEQLSKRQKQKLRNRI